MAGEDTAPPAPSPLACWIHDNRVRAICVDYRMTGTDTADTWLMLTGFGDKAPTIECRPAEFHAVAELRIGYNTCADLKRGVAERIEAYRAFMKRHQRELAEYRRLQRKFGGAPDA